MAARDERARRAAEKHATREERVQNWLDRRMNRKGMRPRFAAYLVIAAWLIAIVTFGIIERIVDPHSFKTIWLAWWWAVQTVTTVGYGDVVPGQTAGKVIGAFLMLGGLSFLSVLTATITSSFISRRQRQAQERGEDPLMRELAAVTERLDSLERELRTARTGAAAADGRGEEPAELRPDPG
jgi:voltage-gated potassium channel